MLTIKNDRHAIEIEWGKAVNVTTKSTGKNKDKKKTIEWKDLNDPNRLYFLVSKFNQMLEIAAKHKF
jgi:hypothetical protein